MTKAVKTRREVQEEEIQNVHSDIGWTDVPNACASRLSIASGISSVATLSTFIGLSVSISLGAVTLAGASVSGVTTALTKKYQKKLSKVTTLTDIIMPALAVFEMSFKLKLKL